MFGLGEALKEIHSRLFNPVFNYNKTCTWKRDYGYHWYVQKKLYGSGYTELRESMTFLPFLFSFLIINFSNFSYNFTLHHCSAISWDFILRLICLGMCIMFLFVSVIILFVCDSDRYGTAATSENELLMTTIYGFQS